MLFQHLRGGASFPPVSASDRVHQFFLLSDPVVAIMLLPAGDVFSIQFDAAHSAFQSINAVVTCGFGRRPALRLGTIPARNALTSFRHSSPVSRSPCWRRISCAARVVISLAAANTSDSGRADFPPGRGRFWRDLVPRYSMWVAKRAFRFR
jgi:hypothetical protein